MLRPFYPLGSDTHWIGEHKNLFADAENKLQPASPQSVVPLLN
jgi:hypothetical protein